MARRTEAEVTVTVDGAEVPLSILMANCKSVKGDPEAQMACFSALSKILEEQEAGGRASTAFIAENVNSLRHVAEFEDEASGLMIAAEGCALQVTYYNNYFHISRRNVSTIDVVAVTFDMGRLQFDQAAMSQGAKAPFARGIMDVGTRAQMRGGIALDSTKQSFEPKSARMPMDDYAAQVASQLPSREDRVFDFVLIHPKKAGHGSEIWQAFSDLASTCRDLRGSNPLS